MSYSDEVLADSPLVYLRLDEATPGTGTAADSSGNGNDATYAGSPSSVAGLLQSDSDSAVAFDSSGNQRVTNAGTGFFVAGADRTFEAWVYRNDTSTNDTIFGSASGPTIFRANSGGTDLAWWPDGGTSNVVWSSVLPVGEAHHVVLTWDSSAKTSELFIDGVSQGNGTGTTPNDFPADSGYEVAHWGAGNDPFYGTLDEFAIYGSILSSARITAHYNAALMDFQDVYPDADTDAGSWTTAPLWSKVDEVSADGTVITSDAAA